ncbi:MAG: hypothetical protein SGCHY_005004, partial [Lobulomycetales sp.]
ERDPTIAEPPEREHLLIHRVIVNKGTYRPDIKIHGKGMFGRVHHPTCRVRITLREILPQDTDLVKQYGSETSVGKKLNEFDKLVHAMKLTKIRKWGLVDRKSPMRYTRPPWSKHGWKYVTKGGRWSDPSAVKINR